MTKTDASKKWVLSPQQETALDLLATGQSITATAEAIDVARQTVSEWLNHHCGFQAALNQRRQDVWRDCADKLRALLPKALDALEAELDGERRLKAAEAIVKMAGLIGQQPQGPTTAEDMEKEREVEESERKGKLTYRALCAM
jgi:hypothetical protein